MTDRRSFAYIEAYIAEGVTVATYRRSRAMRGRRNLWARWLRVVASVSRTT
jgi:hypothetical protein